MPIQFCTNNFCLCSCKQSRNLCNSGGDLLKVEFLKWALILESCKSPAQFWNCAICKVGVLFIVEILHYFPSCVIQSTTIAIIWWGENAELLFLAVLEVAWVVSKKQRIVLNQIALVFADVLLLSHLCNTDWNIKGVTWVHFHVDNQLYWPLFNACFLHDLYFSYLCIVIFTSQGR